MNDASADTATRSPIKKPVKRQAGQSLRDYLTSFIDDQLFFCILPVIFSLFWLAIEYLPPTPHWLVWLFFVFSIVNLAVRFPRIMRRVKRIRQGCDGEQYVAQIIERDLLPEGYRVIHDLFIDKGKRKFNIDHLVIGRNGVFCLETKTWSKPGRGQTIATYDGSKILLNGVNRCGNAVNQARALAQEAHDQILKLVGISVKVTPFLVCVGWFVEKTFAGIPDVLVVNEEGLGAFIKKCPGSLEPDDVERIYQRLMEVFA